MELKFLEFIFEDPERLAIGCLLFVIWMINKNIGTKVEKMSDVLGGNTAELSKQSGILMGLTKEEVE